MSTSHRRSGSTRTLATQGVAALAIALAVNFAIRWIALSQDLVGSTRLFLYPAIALWTWSGWLARLLCTDC